MASNIIERAIWRFMIGLTHFVGLPFHLSPTRLPENQGAKLEKAAAEKDILILFNGGGWGDTPLEQADDFTPILNGIKDTLSEFGLKSEIIPYTRTLKGAAGRLAGIKEQLNSFTNNSDILRRDVFETLQKSPSVKILIAGHSTGGGLVSRGMRRMANLKNVYAITVGTPGWFDNYRSANSLVLNNNFRDPLVSGRVFSIAKAVILTPYVWIKAKIKGEKLSLPLALMIPDHQYEWDSAEVRLPIKSFLTLQFENNKTGIISNDKPVLEKV